MAYTLDQLRALTPEQIEERFGQRCDRCGRIDIDMARELVEAGIDPELLPDRLRVSKAYAGSHYRGREPRE